MQGVSLRALNNARPIHMHRDVRMPDLLEWRIKVSMSRADLNVSLKFSGRTPVIDRDHIPALQVRRDVVDPVKRCLIRLRLVTGWSLNKNKFIAIEANKFLAAAADQAHRQRVQQFVRKIDAHERLQ